MPLLAETLITPPGFRTPAVHRQPVISDFLPGAIDSTMSAASRFALPHVTLLTALCGGAAAQTPAGIAPLVLDTMPRTTPALPAGTTAGAQAPHLAPGDAMSTAHGVGITKPTSSALNLRRTASQRRSTPLGGTGIAAGRLLPVGGVLARISAPSTWPGSLATTDTGRAVVGWAPGAVMSLDQVLGRADRTLDTTETTLPGGMRFIRTRVRQSDNTVIRPLTTLYPRVPTAISQQGSATLLQLRMSSGTTWSVGRGGLAARNLGLADTRLASRLAGLESVVANPLVALVPEHRFASTSTYLGGAWTGRVAWVQGQGCAPCAGGSVMELSHQGRHHAVNLSVASLTEDGGLTDQSDSAGSHTLSPQTRTTGLTLSAAWAVSEEWLVAAAWSAARTTARLPGSVGGQLVADAYGVGLLKTDSWRPGDRLSLALQAPLSTRAGSLSLDGRPGTQGTPATGLQPEAREWTLETRYTARLSADSAVSAAAAYRQNPDHDATATSQMAVGVRYQRAF
jgi:hypothetical protein